MAAEIVHDDDVAGLKHRHELLLEVSAEAVAVYGAIEDARCGELIAAQCSEEGQGAPIAMWSKSPQAFALWTPASQRSHIGLDPSLIDKDELCSIKAGLPCFPSLTPPGDVGARLLKGEQRFF